MSEAVEERRALKDKLLESALLHAAFDGWSRRTLLNAAKDAGVDPEGSGSHRITIRSDAGPFTDPDGFAWEAVPVRTT